MLFEDEVVFKDEDGHGYIKAYTDRYNEYDVNAMFWTIITGFEMLANQYPENICFDVKNEG